MIIQESLREWYQSGSSVGYLIGDPGMGKTIQIQLFAKEHVGDVLRLDLRHVTGVAPGQHIPTLSDIIMECTSVFSQRNSVQEYEDWLDKPDHCVVYDDLDALLRRMNDLEAKEMVWRLANSASKVLFSVRSNYFESHSALDAYFSDDAQGFTLLPWTKEQRESYQKGFGEKAHTEIPVFAKFLKRGDLQSTVLKILQRERTWISPARMRHLLKHLPESCTAEDLHTYLPDDVHQPDFRSHALLVRRGFYYRVVSDEIKAML